MLVNVSSASLKDMNASMKSHTEFFRLGVFTKHAFPDQLALVEQLQQNVENCARLINELACYSFYESRVSPDGAQLDDTRGSLDGGVASQTIVNIRCSFDLAFRACRDNLFRRRSAVRLRSGPSCL
jgi:hypothetical protein